MAAPARQPPIRVATSVAGKSSTNGATPGVTASMTNRMTPATARHRNAVISSPSQSGSTGASLAGKSSLCRPSKVAPPVTRELSLAGRPWRYWEGPPKCLAPVLGRPLDAA